MADAGFYVKTTTGLVPGATVPGPVGATGPASTTPGPKGDKGDPGDMTPAVSANATGTLAFTTANLPSTRTLTLTGNLTITLPTPVSTVSGTITAIFKQAASGGPYTLTLPTLEWPNDAAAPTMPTAANSELVVHFFWTGLNWRPVVGGIYYP